MSKGCVVCVIPARINSTRFPRKILHMFHGKSLIQTTIDNVLSSQLFSKVIVATDSEEIATHVQNVSVVMTSSKPPSGTDRICEAITSNSATKKEPFLEKADIIFNMQADHPLVATKTMEQVIKALQEDKKASIATAVVPCTFAEAQEEQVVKCVLDKQGYAMYFSRSPIPHGAQEFYQHIGLYVYRKQFLHELSSLSNSPLEGTEKLEQLRFLEHGYRIRAAIVEENIGDRVGIDTPQDAHKYDHLFATQS